MARKKRKSKSVPGIIAEPVYDPKKIVKKFSWCVYGLKGRLKNWSRRSLTGDRYIRNERKVDLLEAVRVLLDLCRQGYLYVNKKLFAEFLRILVSEVFGESFEEYLAADFKLKQRLTSISSDGLDALEDVLDKIWAYKQATDDKPSSNEAVKTKQQKHIKTLEGEWSNPMTKSDMMIRLHINGYKKFNTFAKVYGLYKVGNRQLWQIRLDGMDKNTRQKLEKA